MSEKPSVKKTTLGEKVRLGIKERFTIRELFPQQGNLISQVMVLDIDKKVSFSQEEMVNFGFKELKDPDGGSSRWTWDDEKEKIVLVAFTDAEITFLKAQVDRMDKAQEITQDMLSVCQKIKSLDVGE